MLPVAATLPGPAAAPLSPLLLPLPLPLPIRAAAEAAATAEGLLAGVKLLLRFFFLRGDWPPLPLPPPAWLLRWRWLSLSPVI